MEKHQPIECKICGKIVKRVDSLGVHIKSHGISSEEYHLTYIRTSVAKCKCGADNKFRGAYGGWTQQCSKCGKELKPNKITFWLNKGYTETEAKEKVKEHQKKCSKRSVDYWLSRGYNISEAKDMVALHQSRNEEWYLKTFGEIEGKKKWEDLKKLRSFYCSEEYLGKDGKREKIRKWGEGSQLEGFIAKYGEDEGRTRFAQKYGHEKWEDFAYDKRSEYTDLFYDKHYRAKIINEQKHQCGLCSIHIDEYDGYFHLHHIDYDKSNDKRENLVFLCNSCHSKTNYGDRNKWKELFNENCIR